MTSISNSDTYVTATMGIDNLWHGVLIIESRKQIITDPEGFPSQDEAKRRGGELLATHNFFNGLAAVNAPSPTDSTSSPAVNAGEPHAKSIRTQGE